MRKVFLAFLFLSSPAWAVQCDTPSAINQLRPGAEFSLTGSDLSALVWNSTTTPPTPAEVAIQITACLNAAALRNGTKAQAKADVKNTLLTPVQRLNALLVILDLDK